MNGRSIDAMGTQKAIAGQIIDQQADYVLALNENQPTLPEEVKHAFDTMPLDFSAEKVDADYGRVEQRKCEVIQDLRFVDEAANWPALNSIVSGSCFYNLFILIELLNGFFLCYTLASTPFCWPQLRMNG